MLSLGGASSKDIVFIDKNINFRKKDVIFYCVSNYPAALDSINFNYMKQIVFIFDSKSKYYVYPTTVLDKSSIRINNTLPFFYC